MDKGLESYPALHPGLELLVDLIHLRGRLSLGEPLVLKHLLGGDPTLGTDIPHAVKEIDASRSASWAALLLFFRTPVVSGGAITFKRTGRSRGQGVLWSGE